MSKELQVIEQKSVTFYGDELIAVRGDDGHIYVSVRHMCQSLGLARQGQVRRIRDDETLSEGYKGGNVLLPPSPEGRGGGRQHTGLLRVDLIPLWLAGVRVKAAKQAIQPKLAQFKREAAKVLWEAFQEGRLTAAPSFDELMQKDSPAVNAYKTALAIVELARNQVLLEARLDDYGERLERIETTLGDPGRAITPEQATQISQAVKAVAMRLSQQTGRNEYGGVYGELYRRFNVPSYKALPANKFQEALDWLNEWHGSLYNDDDGVPF